MYTLLLIDDEYLVREGLKTTIDWSSLNISQVYEARNGREGLEKIALYKPDIVILDVKMPEMDGLEMLEALDMTSHLFQVIMLSGSDEFKNVKQTLEKGSFSYILKPIKNEEIINNVKRAIIDLEHKRRQQVQLSSFEKHKSSILRQVMKESYDEKKHMVDLKKALTPYEIIIMPSGYLCAVATSKSIDDVKRIQDVFHFDTFVLFDENMYLGFFNERSKEDVTQVIKEGLKKVEISSSLTFNIGIISYDPLNKFHEICDEAIKRAKGTLYKLMNSYAFDTLSHIDNPKIASALEYIASHYDMPLSVDIVSDAIGVSSSYLMHNIKDEIKMTFNQYVTSYRMEKAKSLMSQKTLKIYEIAFKVGYEDVKYFSQVFKKVTGKTPKTFMDEL